MNQLVGKGWSFGGRYRYTHAKFQQQRAGLSDDLASGLKSDITVRFLGETLRSLAAAEGRHIQSDLHEGNLFALFNHPSGLFARADANSYLQQNDDYVKALELPLPERRDEPRPRVHTRNLGLPGEDFWQFNILAGYRFSRNRCEISAGLLNLAGEDYRLNPLVFHLELPRDRTFVVRCRLTF